MDSLSRHGAGALLLAAALAPLPGATADAAHPLDPAASAGVVPTRNVFENLVPLLDRESPTPSFAGEEAAEAPAEAAPAQASAPADHGAMGHGAPRARTE